MMLNDLERRIYCCVVSVMCVVTKRLKLQGSHASWKILESPEIFSRQFPGPGKS